MSPNISIRESIRWLPDDAEEPTTTLVLTSAENRFVDIRILKQTNDSTTNLVGGDVLPTSRLDWAFAGVSSTEIRFNTEGNAILHSTWRHWVDSRNEDAESIIDEGDMFPQSDGRTLEIGSMVNPSTGQMTDYEEYWVDVEPIATNSIERHDDDQKVSAVLQLHDDKHKARGMVVRVGQFCQGVLRAGEHFSLERWQWAEVGGWARTARIGDLWIPCGPILEGERLRLGGEVEFGEFVWRVIELDRFE